MKVLDLASGTGEPALRLAHVVGPQGRVVATDLVPEMLEATLRRRRI
jgi:ubiquinone/menaquinone biosynthesis C-methylase UbiE